jgi:cellulose synthase/poly-beta-1,6-N-acetylglucosamine synthase-like glycosyltransferase
MSASAPPHVSVIVPIYNGVPDLPQLGDCLLAQTFPPDQAEYLLVDNNSQDETLAALHQFAEQAATQGLTVKPLSEDRIQSSYAARNQGIRAARGQLLAFTDADCRPQPDWLEKLVQPFADPAVTLVVGEVQALPSTNWLERYADYRGFLTQKHTLAHSFLPYGQTANLAVRRSVLAQTGLFRPHLTTGGDADFCWRVQMDGAGQLHFTEDAVVRHRHRSTFKALASQWRRYGRSNRYLHELYGVPLQTASPEYALAPRLTRWVLKDLPKGAWRGLQGDPLLVGMAAGLLDIFCGRSREIGQRDAQLPDNARDIEWLEPEDVDTKMTSS